MFRSSVALPGSHCLSTRVAGLFRKKDVAQADLAQVDLGTAYEGLCREERLNLRLCPPYALVTPSRARSSVRSVSTVDTSAMPSTRRGRKWRWNAVTTSWVTPSNWPVACTP